MSLRQQKKQKARAEILSAARRCIAEQGFEQARMRDIAAVADVSYQTLYNYFPTKGSMLKALLTDQLEDLVAEVGQVIVAYQGDLKATLAAVNRQVLSAIRPEDRPLWRQATVDLIEQSPETTALFAMLESQTQNDMQRLLERAVEFGEMRAEVPLALLAETLFTLADYNILRFLMDPDIQPEALLDHLNAQFELLLTPYLRPVGSAQPASIPG